MKLEHTYIDAEFDRFFEFPTDDRSSVSSVSCKLFALAIAQPLLEEIARLRDENANLTYENDKLWAELRVCAAALPGPIYMDPPDGGSVTVAEQVARMAKDAARYRWLRRRNLDAVEHGGVFAGQTPDNVVLNGDDLDAAIDAAMREGE